MTNKKKICAKCRQSSLILYKVKIGSFLRRRLCGPCRYQWNMVYLESEVRKKRFMIEMEIQITIQSNSPHSIKCQDVGVLYDELKEYELGLIKFFHNWEESVEPDIAMASEG